MSEPVFCPFCTTPLKNPKQSLITHVWMCHRPAMVMLRELPADRPRYDWEIERAELQERIAQLEAQVFGRGWQSPPEFRLRKQEEIFLGCLLTYPGYRTRELLFQSINCGNATEGNKLVEVVAHRLRRKLAPFGMTIETRHSRGYYLPPETRARLLNWQKAEAA